MLPQQLAPLMKFAAFVPAVQPVSPDARVQRLKHALLEMPTLITPQGTNAPLCMLLCSQHSTQAMTCMSSTMHMRTAAVQQQQQLTLQQRKEALHKGNYKHHQQHPKISSHTVSRTAWQWP
jgi:hypothetical protein